MDQFGIVGQISKQFYEDIPISNSKDTLTFNTKMLNVLFTKEVSNYLSESTNLNTRKSFAILNDKNNRLFLGGSFAYPFNRNKYDKLTNLFTLGVKADSKDGFANIFPQTSHSCPLFLFAPFLTVISSSSSSSSSSSPSSSSFCI